MQRITGFLVLLSLLFPFGYPKNPAPQPASVLKDTAATSAARLVVFEAFLRPT